MIELFWDEKKFFRSLSLCIIFMNFWQKCKVIGKKVNHISGVLLEKKKTNRLIFSPQNSCFSRFLKNSQPISLFNLNLESFSFLHFHFFQREKAKKNFTTQIKVNAFFFIFHTSQTLLTRSRWGVSREIVKNVGLPQVSHVS